jgi:hypothetical protein
MLRKGIVRTDTTSLQIIYTGDLGEAESAKSAKKLEPDVTTEKKLHYKIKENYNVIRSS